MKIDINKYIVPAVWIIIAGRFSSFSLYLVDSSIKYPLFVIETVLIILFFLIFKYPDVGLSIFNKFGVYAKIYRIYSLHVFDLALIFSSIALLLMSRFSALGGLVQLSLTIFCSSFLVGYAIINIFRIYKYFSRLEIIIFAFIFSFSFSSLLTLIYLPFNDVTKGIIMPISFISVGIISFLRNRGGSRIGINETLRPNSFCKNIDFPVIILCIVFYLTLIFYIYPQAAILSGTDVSRHFDYSLTLLKSSDLYTYFSYLFFHAFESTLYILSGFHQAIGSFQTLQAVLTLFLPLSFYAFSKRFFENMDKRLPAISTIVYVFFSNLSFISFINLKIFGGDKTELALLLDTSNITLNGTQSFLQPFLFFTPATVSYILFISAFLLTRVNNIPRSKFIPIMCVIILAMYFVHVSEAIVFVILLALYSLISKSNVIRTDDVLTALLISFIIISIFNIYELFFWPSKVQVNQIDTGWIFRSAAPFLVPLVFIIGTMILRKKVLPRIRLNNIFNNAIAYYTSNRFYLILSLLLVVFYIFAFETWLFVENFNNSLVADTGEVPWFFYPVMLGINGFLALISIKYINYLSPSLKSIVLMFLFFTVILFSLGRIVSYVNTHFFETGYWETRFTTLIFLFSSLLASISLIKLMDRFNTIRHGFIKIPVSAITISVIVLFGFSSFVLQYVFWKLYPIAYGTDDKQLQALHFLRNTLQHDPHSFTIGLSKASQSKLAFSGTSYELKWVQPFLTFRYPDVPLLFLAAYNLDHAYLYLSVDDLPILKSNSKGWFVGHLLPMLPVVFSNEEATIYNITHMSYPLPNSDTTLLIPKKSLDTSWFYTYDVISQTPNGANYTVMYDDDLNAFRSKTMILSYDPSISSDYINYVKSGGRLIVFNTNGYNSIHNLLTTSVSSVIRPSNLMLPFNDSMSANGLTTIKHIGSGKLMYVDIYALINKLKEKAISNTTFYKILGNISNQLNLDHLTSIPPNFRDGLSIFRQIRGIGNIVANTSSVIFPNEAKITDLNITSGFDNHVVLHNITRLHIDNHGYATLNGRGLYNAFSLNGGNGLYTNISFFSTKDKTNNMLYLSFKGGAAITGVSDSTSFHFNNISGIDIENRSPVSILTRQPNIAFTGQIYKEIGIEKSGLSYFDAKVVGSMSAPIFMSDSYTLAKGLSMKGDVKFLPRLDTYDEYSALSAILNVSNILSLPVVTQILLFILLALSLIFFIYVRESKMSESKKNKID